MPSDSPLFRLNYPVETAEARKFWSSGHKVNRIKSIIAFSLDIVNANDNLRRAGYNRPMRKRALFNLCMYVNKPSMAGIPFSQLSDIWYVELPNIQHSKCSVKWDDTELWNDAGVFAG